MHTNAICNKIFILLCIYFFKNYVIIIVNVEYYLGGLFNEKDC